MAVEITTINGTDHISPTPINNNFNNVKSAVDALQSKIEKMDTAFTGSTTLISTSNCKVVGVKFGRIVQLTLTVNHSNNQSWGSENIGTLPENWRPAVHCVYTHAGRDNSNMKDIHIDPNGAMSYQNSGGPQSNYGFTETFMYISSK